MPNSTDSFEAWLATLPPLGYDRDWIRRNVPALRQRWITTGDEPMEPAPSPPLQRARDRYEEL